MSNVLQHNQKIRVGIIGATGYTGAELVRLLALHPHVEITLATASGDRAGQNLGSLFPALNGITGVVTEEYSLPSIREKCDFAFIALGHGKALDVVPSLLEAGLKVCDLGADFRLRDPETYRKWYKLEHTAFGALAEAVYGLPEWNREKIKTARLVANPGCYVTTATLALAPLLAAGAIEPNSIIVDAASGVSGAGRSSFSVDYHFPELHGNFKAYGVTSHRHRPEIEQVLADASHTQGHQPKVIFTPHLLPIARGILATSYVQPSAKFNGCTGADFHKVLSHYYDAEPFVRVLELGQFPQVKNVAGSNFCDIGLALDDHTGRLIVISALDNLVKGASGQAVQNMNLMCGFEETESLKSAALFP